MTHPRQKGCWGLFCEPQYNYIYIYIYVCVCVCDIQSATEDSGCELFFYRIYEEYHINLGGCSMYCYCYIAYSLAGLPQNSHSERI